MADKAIGDLTQATYLDDESLLVVEQQGEAMKMTGKMFADFAREAAAADVQKAVDAAADASKSAITAQQYSGNPPIIQDSKWWIWNANTQQYEDTGTIAVGGVTYATFEVDPSTGLLTMRTDDGYSGPSFVLNNGILEVVV